MGIHRGTVAVLFSLCALWNVQLATGAAASSTLIPAGTEFQVNSYTTSFQQFPEVAIDNDGAFVVVWSSNFQDGSSSFGVFARRYSSNGDSVGTEFRVNTYTTGPQFNASVAAGDDGDFIVVWDGQGPGDQNGVFARRYDSVGGALGPEFRVNSYVTPVESFPSIGMDAAGGFVITYRRGGGADDFNVFAQRFSSAGIALGTEFIVNSGTADSETLPRVAVAAAGNFAIVWYACTGGSSCVSAGSPGVRVLGQRYDSAGDPLGTEFQVNTYTTGDHSLPQIASGAVGDFVVVWRGVGIGDSDGGIFAQRYDSAGGAIGTEFLVNSYTTGFSSAPSVGADAEGGFLVAWDGAGNGDIAGVFAQRYSSTGAPVGGEFLVNTYTATLHRAAAVGMNPNGDAVITWISTGQDGSSDGVFAQRYQLCGNGEVGSTEGCDEGADNGSGNSCCDANCRFKPNGNASCDGNVCTRPDSCTDGVCAPGTCADGGECTFCGGLCVDTGSACECQ